MPKINIWTILVPRNWLKLQFWTLVIGKNQHLDNFGSSKLAKIAVLTTCLIQKSVISWRITFMLQKIFRQINFSYSLLLTKKYRRINFYYTFLLSKNFPQINFRFDISFRFLQSNWKSSSVLLEKITCNYFHYLIQNARKNVKFA